VTYQRRELYGVAMVEIECSKLPGRIRGCAPGDSAFGSWNKTTAAPQKNDRPSVMPCVVLMFCGRKQVEFQPVPKFAPAPTKVPTVPPPATKVPPITHCAPKIGVDHAEK
jgi:hypothetical protein